MYLVHKEQGASKHCSTTQRPACFRSCLRHKSAQWSARHYSGLLWAAPSLIDIAHVETCMLETCARLRLCGKAHLGDRTDHQPPTPDHQLRTDKHKERVHLCLVLSSNKQSPAGSCQTLQLSVECLRRCSHLEVLAQVCTSCKLQVLEVRPPEL
jgi:hypothetical protein